MAAALEHVAVGGSRHSLTRHGPTLLPHQDFRRPYACPRHVAAAACSAAASVSGRDAPACSSSSSSRAARRGSSSCHAGARAVPRGQQQQQQRQRSGESLVAAAGSRSVSSNLISVLKDELKYEREAYRKPALVNEEPPNGFEKEEDVPGTSVFTLYKRHNSEDVRIMASIDAELDGGAGFDDDEADGDDDDEADEDEEDGPVEFQVTVRKDDAGQELVFACESDGEYLVINSVSLRYDYGGELQYAGPAFEELDDTLQQAFVDYLEDRGVNADIGEYVRLYVEDKMALEYQRWLGQVKEFIAK